MRFASGVAAAAALVPLLSASHSPNSPIARSRYAMGTMFDIVAYDATREAVERALDEVVRLDGVLSHFKPDSDLSRLVRDGRRSFVGVDPALYDVLAHALVFSKQSRGAFDVTIAPLLRTWKAASEADRQPTSGEIARARACVGYEHIDLEPPNRIRLRSDCLDLDLGGIGKGYAVDRAMAILRTAGIRDAVVNAGTSSIAAIGSAPGERGWPVRLGAGRDAPVLRLRDASISTSQQAFASGARMAGDILDPRTGAPAETAMSVSVVAPTATASDALSTTLLILPVAEGRLLLQHFTGVSAAWISPEGKTAWTFGREW